MAVRAFQPLAFRAADNERAPLRSGTTTITLPTCLPVPLASHVPTTATLLPLPDLTPDVNRWALADATDTTWHVLGHVDRPRHPRDPRHYSLCLSNRYRIVSKTRMPNLSTDLKTRGITFFYRVF